MSRYQKEEQGRKGNGVCWEDKESTKESRSSIEESTKWNKVISR